MRRTIPILTLLVLVAGFVAVAVDRPEAGAVPRRPAVEYGLTGPAELSEWTGVELVPATMPLASTETSIMLGFRSDLTGLDARASAVSDPASPSYGDHRTVAENAATFNATDEQVRTVVDWFDARGVAVAPDATRTFVLATVTITLLEELTGTTYGAYAPPGDPTSVVLVSPTTALSTIVPDLEAAIDRVVGAVFIHYPLAPATSRVGELPRPAVSSVRPTTAWELVPADGGTPWRTGTAIDACPDAAALADGGAPIGLSPAQLRTAYGIDRLWDEGFRGRGARIAVVDYAGYEHSDLETWRTCFGLEGTPITDHVLGPLVTDRMQRLETTLDLQAVVSLAPEAERIDWFGVPADAPTTVGTLVALLAPAFDASLTGGVAPDVITVSFAVCEPQIVSLDPASRVGVSLFDQMVATGVASGIGTFVASGDRGSTGCFPETYDVAASFPATSRWVTAVGGTNLTLDAQNRIVSSGVWNDTRMVTPTPPIDMPFDSGGGGSSILDVQQPWQAGVVEGPARHVPDVSHFADPMPGAFLRFDGEWSVIGGTSLASPLLATSFALQSSVRAARGAPRLGFVAPLLYAIATSDDPLAVGVIVDVVLGNDDAHGAGVYDATPGYDLASGLGWIRQDALLDLLDAPDPVPDEPVVPAFTG